MRWWIFCSLAAFVFIASQTAEYQSASSILSFCVRSSAPGGGICAPQSNSALILLMDPRTQVYYGGGAHSDVGFMYAKSLSAACTYKHVHAQSQENSIFYVSRNLYERISFMLWFAEWYAVILNTGYQTLKMRKFNWFSKTKFKFPSSCNFGNSFCSLFLQLLDLCIGKFWLFFICLVTKFDQTVLARNLEKH